MLVGKTFNHLGIFAYVVPNNDLSFYLYAIWNSCSENSGNKKITSERNLRYRKRIGLGHSGLTHQNSRYNLLPFSNGGHPERKEWLFHLQENLREKYFSKWTVFFPRILSSLIFIKIFSDLNLLQQFITWPIPLVKYSFQKKSCINLNLAEKNNSK